MGEDWRPDAVLDTWYDADSPFGMVESSQKLLLALGSYIRNNEPDLVVALTDRYETLAVAQTAMLMNVRIAHIQGGEITGSIDESIRHAVTKLSHLHFVSNKRARSVVVGKLGEDPDRVWVTGCPSIDLLLRLNVTDPPPVLSPYLLVLHHPVTTEYDDTRFTSSVLMEALYRTGINLHIVGPNHDAGRLAVTDNIIQPYSSTMEHRDFVRLMAHASVMVGNSSAGIRESCYFGTPVVNVGSRQRGRHRGSNVVDAGYDADEIYSQIMEQLNHGRYLTEYLYGEGDAGEQIARILAETELPPIQKRLERFPIARREIERAREEVNIDGS